MEEKKTPTSQTVVEFEDKKKFNAPAFLLWITFVISILFAGFLWISTSGLNSTISDKNIEKDNIVTQIESSKFATVEKNANAVADAVSTLTLVSNSEVSTSDLLKDLYSYITKDVKVTSFAIAGDNTISIDGATASYKQAADFIVALKSSEKISDVSLSTISVSTSDDGAASGEIVFTVSAVIDRTKTANTSESN